MSDRAFLFLISLAVEIAAISSAVWLIATGQTGTFDGNFLLVSSLLIAAAFALYLRSVIRKAMEQPKPSPAAEKKVTRVEEPVGKL